jgi:integrase/recombinase XerC
MRSLGRYCEVMKIELALREYLAFYASGDSNTERAKRLDARIISQFFCQSQIEAITQSDVRRFLTSREELGEAPATIERRFSTLRHFFKFCAESFGVVISPCRGIQAPRVFYGLPKRVSSEQLAAIRQGLDGCDYRTTRQCVAFQLLLGTGLRRDELKRLEVQHLDLDRGLIIGLLRKGKVTEPIAIPDKVIRTLKQFLPLRDEHLHKHAFRYADVPAATKGRYPLLCSTYRARERNPMRPEDWRMNDKAIWEMIAKLGEATGKHIHPHQLRHTFGDRVMRATNSPRLTAKALGHRSLNQVMRYTELTEEDVRKVINGEGFDER